MDLKHRTQGRVFLLAMFFFGSIAMQQSALAADNVPKEPVSSIGSTIADDYSNFYSHDRLVRLGIAFGLGGIAANTNIDMNVRNWYQDKMRNAQTDSWASKVGDPHGFYAKTFGEGPFIVPIVFLTASVNLIEEDTAVGNWAAYASRAYIVGLPPMWGMQFVTGAARPSENLPEGSSWRPINVADGHGVSGHSFVGAVPFLTVAAMNPDNAWVKYPAYFASMAAGWSRINDDAHFPSQVVLGWYMAWEAVDTVMDTNKNKKKGVTVAPMVDIDGFGLIANASW
jgi:hypothetical protein